MTRPFRPAVAGLWECVGVLASLFAATHSAESVRGRIALQKHCVPNPNLACQNVTFASITSLCLLWLRRRCKSSGWRPVVAVIDWINASHWFLARLFFDNMCHQAGRACNHENAVESGGVHSEIGKDRTDRAVHINRQRPFRL